ncbi:MAG: DeoR/GlpR family DNA-binding transcription regulator [Bryobacteraceae bacterium]|nr:DeoR/GlpR family DNA-binding transcription regulator [Bryobacteraceae bacterium]
MAAESAKLFTEERRSRILQILEREHRVAVPDLAARLRVSEDTVRRDLRRLEAHQLIKKTHGGALRHTAPPVGYATRLVQATEIKEAIGRRAAELVEEGDSVIIDGATTALSLASALTVSKATVLTNSLEVAQIIMQKANLDLIVLGGRLDPLHHQLVGPATLEQLPRYRVDKLFLGMGALDRETGLTEPTEDDAAVKRTMIQMAQQVIGLADHSKLGRVAFAYVAPASVIDVLVTDDLADCDEFEDLNWDIIRVPSEGVESECPSDEEA